MNLPQPTYIRTAAVCYYGAVLSMKKWIFVVDTATGPNPTIQKDDTALSPFYNINKLVFLPTLPTHMTVKAPGSTPYF